MQKLGEIVVSLNSKTQTRTKNEDKHDERFSKLASLKDVLHLLMQMLLAETVDDANVLVIGAGAGPELLYLAEVFPKYRFSVVEPDKNMLDVCVQKCEQYKILSRCTFHDGPLQTLAGNKRFDVATSILVSHYLADEATKCAYFADIASRLLPDGLLIGADLVTHVALDNVSSLLNVWKRTMDYANAPVPPHVPAISPQELRNIVTEGGFEQPIIFYQALLINAWFARKREN